MSYVYTGTDTNATAVTLPSDGDPKDAASVDVPFETIWDRLNHLNAPEQTSGEDYKYAVRSETRVQRITAIFNQGDWLPSSGADPIYTCLSASQKFISQPLELPHGSTLTQYIVYLDGANTHGALPGTMPSVQLYEYDLTTMTASAVPGAGASDSSPDVASYEVPHAVVVDVDPDYVINTALFSYFINIASEHGANAQTGLRYGGCSTTVEVDHVDGGAS